MRVRVCVYVRMYVGTQSMWRCLCSAPVAAAAVFSLLLAASRVAREKFAECEIRSVGPQLEQKVCKYISVYVYVHT